jgi:hypothetical protein
MSVVSSHFGLASSFRYSSDNTGAVCWQVHWRIMIRTGGIALQVRSEGKYKVHALYSPSMAKVLTNQLKALGANKLFHAGEDDV